MACEFLTRYMLGWPTIFYRSSGGLLLEHGLPRRERGDDRPLLHARVDPDQAPEQAAPLPSCGRRARLGEHHRAGEASGDVGVERSQRRPVEVARQVPIELFTCAVHGSSLVVMWMDSIQTCRPGSRLRGPAAGPGT